MDEMLANDLFHVATIDKSVPNRVRIDHHHWPVLALVETSKLVCSDLPLQARALERVFESLFELLATFSCATGSGCRFVAFIGADEQVMLELRH